MTTLTVWRTALLTSQPGDPPPPTGTTVTGVATSTITVSGGVEGTALTPGPHLPSGFASTDVYNETLGAAVFAADTTAGWSLTQASSVPLAVDTSFGFDTVRGSIQAGPTALMRLNLPADVARGQATRLVVPVRWSPINGFAPLTPDATYVLKVGSAVNLGGTVAAVPFPAYTSDQFLDLVVDVSALTAVRSIGIGVLSTAATPVPGSGVVFNVGAVRYANLTPLDQALDSADTVAAVISPTYTTGVPHDHRPPDPRRPVVDLRPDATHITRLGGVRHLREWGVTEDGYTDVAAQLGRSIGDLDDGDTLVFPAGRHFRADRPIVINDKRDITVDLNGSTIYTTIWRGGNNNVQDNILRLIGCRDVTVRDGRLLGYRERFTNGADLTASGATFTPTGTPFFARAAYQQLPAATRALVDVCDPRFKFGNVHVARLSDTAHTAGDCVFELVTVDDPAGVVVASRSLTLTGTPTDYVITYDPVDLRVRYKPQVRKATSAANTITVTSTTDYGYVTYSASHDSASAVTAGAGCRRLLFEGLHVEGAATDGFDFSHGDTAEVTIRGCVSRGSSRQGMSFNYGTGYLVEGFDIGESGRSGIDIEPYADEWFVRSIRIRGGLIANSTNYAFAVANWARVFDLHISDVDVVGARVGLIIGGGHNSTISHVRSDTNAYSGASGAGKAILNGIGMRVTDVSHTGPMTVAAESMSYDGDIYTSAGNMVAGVRLIGGGLAVETGNRAQDVTVE